MGKVATLAAVSIALAAAAPVHAAQQSPPPLNGPSGTSSSKVLVIGTDGTRFDLVRREIAAGNAPRFAQLGEEGFAVPSLLAYAPPEAATLSEVGWASVATGVWPAKHGVNGAFLNMDPRQATKNGYPDFLTRIEQLRPELSTFLASNWGNIGLHESGGPIFGDRIDARSAVSADNDIASWDRSDQEIADVSARYLREGNPDAGFVYLGIVDETAHLDGSANPRYLQAIRDTDRRIGQMLDAIRARPSYRSERWVVIVTTDHGQQDLTFPSLASHGFGSDLERTSFVAAAGFGLDGLPGASDIRVVDVAPTVLARLGIPIDPAWRLDGQPFSTAPAEPQPAVDVRRRGREQLRFTLGAPDGSAALRSARLTLPRGLSAGRVTLTRKGDVKRSGRSLSVKVAAARTLRVRVQLAERARRTLSGRRVRLSIVDASGRTTKLVARVR